jgi:hypothetical protein
MSTSQVHTLIAGEDKSTLSDEWIPWLRFQIEYPKNGDEYKEWLREQIADFIKSLDQRNHFSAQRFGFSEIGLESGIGGISTPDGYFDHCKVYFYDGLHFRCPEEPEIWKGILLANHADQKSKVQSLYEIAEHLERFLQERKINYVRYGNTPGKKSGEIPQITVFN